MAEAGQIAALAHIADGVELGSGCRIDDHAHIDADVTLGDRVHVGPGACITGSTRIDRDVSVGANATIGAPDLALATTSQDVVVHAGASVGAGAVVAPGVEIGRGAVVASGSVVTRSVPPYAVVTGNPAQVQRYIDAEAPDTVVVPNNDLRGNMSLSVHGAHLCGFPEITDFRGALTFSEMPSDEIPFVPQRWFLVHDVPNRELRGEHAHRVCHQFLVCVAGSVTVAVDDGQRRVEVELDRPNLGLYVPPMVWGSQYHYEKDSVLLVLASHRYDADDYIRDYETFLAQVSRTSGSGPDH